MACFEYSDLTATNPDVFEKAWNEFVGELYWAGLEPADDEPVFVAHPGPRRPSNRTYEYYKIQPIETDADDDGTAQAPELLSGHNDVALRGTVEAKPGPALT